MLWRLSGSWKVKPRRVSRGDVPFPESWGSFYLKDDFRCYRMKNSPELRRLHGFRHPRWPHRTAWRCRVRPRQAPQCHNDGPGTAPGAPSMSQRPRHSASKVTTTGLCEAPGRPSKVTTTGLAPTWGAPTSAPSAAPPEALARPRRLSHGQGGCRTARPNPLKVERGPPRRRGPPIALACLPSVTFCSGSLAAGRRRARWRLSDHGAPARDPGAFPCLTGSVLR